MMKHAMRLLNMQIALEVGQPNQFRPNDIATDDATISIRDLKSTERRSPHPVSRPLQSA
jgi:hypothetical protein